MCTQKKFKNVFTNIVFMTNKKLDSRNKRDTIIKFRVNEIELLMIHCNKIILGYRDIKMSKFLRFIAISGRLKTNNIELNKKNNRTKIIKFRVSEIEFQMIQGNMIMQGYENIDMSKYLRIIAIFGKRLSEKPIDLNFPSLNFY